jgi:uncharacterized protein
MKTQDFLSRNNFFVLVSLDGNRENHDRNRRSIDGKNTFDVVYRNLIDFRKRYPKQFIAVVSCYDYGTSLMDMMDFVDSNNIDVMQFSKVADSCNYYKQFSYKQKSDFVSAYGRAKKLFAEKAVSDTLKKGEFLNRFFGVSYASFAYHPLIAEKKPKVRPFASTCVPGEKIYVEANGDFAICEKVDNRVKIGNVETGLDFEIVAGVMNSFNTALAAHCKECCISRLCGMCFKDFSSKGGYTCDRTQCDCAISNSKEMMADYVSLLEKKPALFDNITTDYYETLSLIGELI